MSENPLCTQSFTWIRNQDIISRGSAHAISSCPCRVELESLTLASSPHFISTLNSFFKCLLGNMPDTRNGKINKAWTLQFSEEGQHKRSKTTSYMFFMILCENSGMKIRVWFGRGKPEKI